MTPNARRQTYVLGTLVALLLVVLYIRFRGDATAEAPAAPASSAAEPSNEATRGGARGLPVTDVKLQALKHDETSLTLSDRNPFRFKPRALPPAARVVAPPPPAYTPPVVTGPPPPPAIPLRYVGLLGSATQPDRVAVLSDARGNPFYGKEGDIIEGRYRVLRIAADSVDVAYADGRGQQTLRLSSQ